jgi:polysaccharide biosynthesis transport protein
MTEYYKDPILPPSSALGRSLPQRYQALPAETDGFEVSSYLRSYWNILLKRKWTILASAFVVVSLAAIFAFKARPIYQAISKVAIEAEPPRFQNVQNLDEPQPTDTTFLATQVNVLSSDDLAWETIQQLHLDENPRFAPAARESASNQGKPDAVETQLIRTFDNALNVQLLNGTRIVQVSFESPDPSLAARVVNALVSNYTEYNFRTKFDATRQASAWMEQRLEELKSKVEKSQEALVDYERSNSIVAIGGDQNVMEQRLGNLSQDLTAAQNDLAQKQSLFQLAQANPAEVGVLVQDPLLQSLQGKIGDLQTQYADTLAQYGPKFPKVVRLHDQIQQISSLMDQQRKQTLDRIRHDYQSALGRERILASRVDQETAAIGKANQLQIQQNILKHEFQTNQDLYDGLLMHVKNAMVSAGMHANNVHVIDHALVPSTPVRPRKGREIAVGLIVGLMLGITIAFVQEGFDSSIKNAEDVERFLPAPALAVIPSSASVGPRSSWRSIGGAAAARNDGAVGLAVTKMPFSPIAESFRTLRTSILLSTAPRPPQVILVTSTQPREGKTSTSLNLAQSLAQRGGKVLIIDGDLRKPGVAQGLGRKAGKGLSGVLTGAYSLDEALICVEPPVNLWALTSGPNPPNPAELLSSPAMEDLLKDLRSRFDYLVIDSPPLLAVTDATVLSALVDGIVLVVECGVTPRNAVARSFRMLQDAGGRVLGTVINKMDLRHDGYYGYSYRRYYGNYHNGEETGVEQRDESLVEKAGTTLRL